MRDETTDPMQGGGAADEPKSVDDVLEEFSIMELEDRFEFVMKCDGNCSCHPPQPQ